MTGKPCHLKRSAWATDDQLWSGRFEGADVGTNVTVLFFSTDKIGHGPKWHVHTYDEVFILRAGRALFTIGEEKIEAEAGDTRIGAMIAIDPAMTYSLVEESVAAVAMPMLLINFGDAERWAAVDVGPQGSDLARRLPNAEYATFAPANHFAFLAVCKPGGADILAAEADDPVCDDPEGADRAAIHGAIIDRISVFLKL